MADIFLPDSSDDQGYILSVYENSLTEEESSKGDSSCVITTSGSSDENSNDTPLPDNVKHIGEDEPNGNTEQSPEAEESSEERKEEGMDVDDPLNPFSSVKEELEHLLGMVESEYIHHRQMAIRKMLGCLERASSNPENLQMAISIMYKLSEDEESLVRSELIQHVPSFALFCQGHSDETRRVVRQHLIPYTVKLLNDSQIGVRKLGQTALVGLLLEDGMIDKSQLSEWICPLVSQLASCDSNLEELRIEDVNLMTKMIPFVGRDITIKFFLEPFTTLCGDPSFGIRKICAMDFGVICRVVGTETTEASLIRVFTDLCGDAAWGIRKACADVFVEVASIVTLKTRKEVLPHLFISLLNDYSQYVKYTAYQALGKFIFTFADPASSGLALVKGRVVRLHPVEQDSNNNQGQDPPTPPPPSPPHKPKESVSVSSKDEHVFVHVGEGSYNEFQFWRTPLPEVELDIDLDGGGATNILVRAKAPSGGGTSEIKVRIAPAHGDGEVQVQTARINTITTSEEQEVCSSRYEEATYSFRDNHLMGVNSVKMMGLVEPLTTQLRDDLCPLLRTKEVEEKPLLMTPYDQDIVPPELLSRFISVAGQHFPVYDFSSKQSEEERVGCCAYSFPAVALTLGSRYWPCLQPTCDKLAKDTKWTIRKTIASSLHELATILGPDLTAKDLLPIFLDLLKDVDEVRMKLIQHLHDFLAPLQPIWRRMFLPIIEEFSKVDNERNWRFRCTVAEQLRLAVELFDSFEVMKYFLPIALGCVEDKVSAVRVAGVQLVAVILKHMMQEECTKRHVHTLLKDLTHHLDSPKWVWRQTYVLLCEQFVIHGSIPEEMFAELVAPELVHRAWDNVPNVRIALSRCFAKTLKPRGFLPSIEKVKPALFKQVMYKLDADVDDDVRYFAKLLTTT